MKVAGYSRVSSETQCENTSLEAQRRQIEAYATLKGFDLVALYEDAGISGSKPIGERPAGKELVRAVESGEIGGVIIVKLDRGFRNTVDCLQSVQAWEKLGVALHICDMGGSSVDTQSPAGRFMLTVLVAAAEMERGRIAERCNQGRRIRKDQGFRVGEIPLGFDLERDTNKLVENSTEQTAIRLIRELKIEGYSLRQVAAELNRRGFTGKEGAAWSHKSVSRVLARS